MMVTYTNLKIMDQALLKEHLMKRDLKRKLMKMKQIGVILKVYLQPYTQLQEQVIQQLGEQA